MDLMGYEKRFV